MHRFKIPSLTAIVYFLSLNATATDFSNPSQVIIPGGAACEKPWAKNIQANASVRMEYEFINSKTGGLLPPGASPYGQNPQQFCSGNLVNVNGQLKLLTASHCIKGHLRKPPKSVLAKMSNAIPTSPQNGTVPFEAYKKRITAHIGGSSTGFEIDSFNSVGPEYKYNKKDKEDSYRKNDFVLADLKDYNGVHPKNLPILCDPQMRKEDISESVVIGFGLTDNGALSAKPLCGPQSPEKIAAGIIEIAPYKSGQSGACPGDSGAGLWVMPKATTENPTPQPCLAGVVSGPKTATLDMNQLSENPLDECRQEGVVAMFCSVYQNVGPYLDSRTQKPSTNGQETLAPGHR